MLILTTPNTFSMRIHIEAILKESIGILNLDYALKHGEHVSWHSEETLVNMAKRYQFKLQALYYEVPKPTNWKTKLLTAILLRILGPKFFAPRIIALFIKSNGKK